MIVYLTFLFLVMAYAAASIQRRYHPSYAASASKGKRYTFLVDPPTFFIVGLLLPMIAMINLKKRKLTRKEYDRRKRVTDGLLLTFALGFWIMEGMTYFNVIGHPFDPSKTGNDFMWNGYIEWLTGPLFAAGGASYESLWWNLLAVAFWLLQPAALWLGRSLGYNSAFFNDLHNWSRPKR